MHSSTWWSRRGRRAGPQRWWTRDRELPEGTITAIVQRGADVAVYVDAIDPRLPGGCLTLPPRDATDPHALHAAIARSFGLDCGRTMCFDQAAWRAYVFAMIREAEGDQAEDDDTG
jgi:hypothetical protein